MHTFLKFVSRNFISVLAVAYSISYLVIETPNLLTGFAVVCAIYILLGGALILASLCKKFIYERESIQTSFLYFWFPIILFASACLYLYIVKDWAFLSAFLIGDVIFGGFFAIYFFIKKQFK